MNSIEFTALFDSPPMTEQITTKPFRSQAQWRMAFARGLPFARRWAHETPGGPKKRYQRLPVKVTVKAPNYGARAGQTIAGNLRRGSSGKFESGGGSAGLNAARDQALSARRQPKPAKPGRGRRVPKPKKTPEQRAAERQQRQAERERERQAKRTEAEQAKRAERNRILAEAGLGDMAGLAGALIDARDGNTITPANGAELAKRGLAEQAKDGSYRLTPAGREVANAANRGDAGAVRDTMSRASDRAAAQRERAAASAAEQAKPKPAGGGGGGKKPKKPPAVRMAPTRSARAPERVRPGATPSASSRPELPSRLVDAARALSEGRATNEDELIRNGLARRNRDGSVSLTASGLRAIREKAETYGGTKRSNLDDSVFAGPDRSFPIKTAQDVRDAVRSLGRTTHDKAAVKRGIIRRARAIGATDALPESWRAKSFAVYKDARGALRWVAYSSNAYRDRDAEIVSTKALADDCARADADKAYGPLRWWHVPGWELGQCDFNAMHGRVLVESGTFKSAAIGAAVARAAPQLQLSIGFTHAPDEPDRHGVFHHIRRFERSLVPGGRAANPFTQLIVKESPMDTEKEAALKAALGDDAAAQVLSGAEQVQKDADDRKTAYKSDTDRWSQLGSAIALAIQTTFAPESVTTKAEEVAEKAVEVPAAETKDDPPLAADAAMVETQQIDEVDDGTMSADDFLAAIGQLIDAKLAPIAGLLDIEKKVAGHVQSLMQPYVAQKDATDAERQQEIASLKTAIEGAQKRLAALEGDVPAALKSGAGFKASTDDSTVLKPEVAEQLTGVSPGDEEWNRILVNMWGSPIAANGQQGA